MSWLVYRTRALRTPSNMMVVALALSDLIMINTQAPPLFINVFMGKYWAFGPLMCKFYGFLGGVFGEFRFDFIYFNFSAPVYFLA